MVRAPNRCAPLRRRRDHGRDSTSPTATATAMRASGQAMAAQPTVLRIAATLLSTAQVEQLKAHVASLAGLAVFVDSGVCPSASPLPPAVQLLVLPSARLDGRHANVKALAAAARLVPLASLRQAAQCAAAADLCALAAAKARALRGALARVLPHAAVITPSLLTAASGADVAAQIVANELLPLLPLCVGSDTCWVVFQPDDAVSVRECRDLFARMRMRHAHVAHVPLRDLLDVLIAAAVENLAVGMF